MIGFLFAFLCGLEALFEVIWVDSKATQCPPGLPKRKKPNYNTPQMCPHFLWYHCEAEKNRIARYANASSALPLRCPFLPRHVETLQPNRPLNQRENALNDEKPSSAATSDSGRSRLAT